jgi:hypothetical protein
MCNPQRTLLYYSAHRNALVHVNARGLTCMAREEYRWRRTDHYDYAYADNLVIV